MKNNFIQLYRYTWVKNQINLKNIGLEIGSKSEFSKNIIDSSIFFLSGNKDDFFLDFKNVNYLDTDFNDSTFDYLFISDLELNNLLNNYSGLDLKLILADELNGYFFYKILKN